MTYERQSAPVDRPGILLMVALAAALTACHAKPSARAMGLGPPDDTKNYFGPIIRSRADVPDFVIQPLCAGISSTPCFADPGEKWESSDLIRDSRAPTQQLVWLRRMGRNYVMYRLVGGFSSSAEFVILSPRGPRYAVGWSAELAQYDATRSGINSSQRPPPPDLDHRIVNVIRHVFTDRNPCSPDDGMARNSSECPAVNKWPYR
jgi:hypothetical protein